jgi:NADPH2:quinone reductase
MSPGTIGRNGAYASERIPPAALAVRLPPGINEQVAATVLLKGLTAEMLVREVHRIQPGDVVLVHGAAGGVGRLLCQLARHLGATVIGTVGSEAKAEMACRAGCTSTASSSKTAVPLLGPRLPDCGRTP